MKIKKKDGGGYIVDGTFLTIEKDTTTTSTTRQGGWDLWYKKNTHVMHANHKSSIVDSLKIIEQELARNIG